MADNEQMYHVKYVIAPYPEGFPKSAVDLAKGEGACDDIIIHSIVRSEAGDLSHMVLSCDGRRGAPVEAADQWQIWALWAAALMEDEDLDESRRLLCQMVHETVKEAVLRGRATEEGTDGQPT